MSELKNLAAIRREYNGELIDENQLAADPVIQFQLWLSAALVDAQYDVTAMVCATVDASGFPDARIVLLKGIENGGFVFYTNYKSVKATQLEQQPYAALNFYWPNMARQVRIRGTIKRTTASQSDEYFYSRPLNSQINALISPQSQKISNREELEVLFEHALTDYADNHNLQRPEHWGGYVVMPYEMEFWQGCSNRLHDRIQYICINEVWQHQRLAP